MQAIVFFLQLFHSSVQVFARAGGGGNRGFLHREQHAVIAVYLGIKLLGIIGKAHLGNIRKVHGADLPDRIVEKHPALQLLQIGKPIADLKGKLPFTALNIAGRHREILCHQ